MTNPPPSLPLRSSRVERIPAQRYGMILDHLRRRRAASIQELADTLGASVSTIRRDLDHLVENGYLERTHGGATLRQEALSTFEPDGVIAPHLASQEKQAIGRVAADLVEDGNSVIFDSSSTVRELARAVVERGLRITAVTNDLLTAQILGQSDAIRVVVPGGTIRPGSFTLTGEPGEDFLRTLHTDWAFIGTHAITDGVLTETSIDAARMKRAMIAAARHAVVLADSSKFTSPSFCTICQIGQLQGIVTDRQVAPDIVKRLREQAVTVWLGAPEGEDGAG